MQSAAEQQRPDAPPQDIITSQQPKPLAVSQDHHDQNRLREQQEINLGDIQYAAQFFKQVIFGIQNNQTSNLEPDEEYPESKGNSESQRKYSINSSDQVDTPQFGRHIQYNLAQNASPQESSLQNQHFNNNRQNQKNIGQIVNTMDDELYLSKQNVVQVVDAGIEQKNTTTPTQARGQQPKKDPETIFTKISRLPLYGIDHSRQYFQTHPVLSIRLKAYQDFVRLFCSTPVTSSTFQQQLRLNSQTTLSGPEAHLLALAVFRNIFRRFQQYLFNLCKKPIVKLEEADMPTVCDTMLNCESRLGKGRLATLHKIMKLAFDMPVRIAQKEALQFYGHLMEYLIQKKDQEQKESQFELDYGGNTSENKPIWNLKNEQFFCRLYIHRMPLTAIAEELNTSEGLNVTIFDLKYRLQRLIRDAFRKVQHEFRLYDLGREYPLLIGQREWRTVATDPKGANLRLLLLKVHIKKEIYLEDMKKIVEALQSLLKQNNKIKMAAKVKVQKRTPAPRKQKITEIVSVQSAQQQVQQQQQSQQSDVQQYYTPKQYPKKLNNSKPQEKQLTLQQTYSHANRRPQTPKTNKRPQQAPTPSFKTRTQASQSTLARRLRLQSSVRAK